MAPGAAAALDATSPADPASNGPGGNGADAVAVTVEPAPLTIIGAPKTVEVCRQGDSSFFAGVVAAVRAVDPRSTDAGWKLGITVQRTDSRSDGHATIEVRKVEAFARTAKGIVPARAADAEAGRPVVVLTALPGFGAGAFDVWIAVSIELPAVQGDTARLGVGFDLDP